MRPRILPPVRITVFCGSSSRVSEQWLALARALGGEIARSGHVLIYGGGRTGLMGAVADGALHAGGVVRGVILREFIEREAHHMGLAELYSVDDMRARKAGLDERADGFVALPGGLGTFEELTEILSFRKLALHHRTTVLLNAAGYWEPFLALVERAIAERFDRAEVRGYFQVTDDPVEAVRLLESARG